jgi:ABC-type branched-subunit amino acid transport system ATPase component/branched-subunit amino acid ABC-type transport system permease component
VTVKTFFTFVVSGAVSGAIYSLVASGLVLSYSATGIFNLSYGAVAYVSAVVYFELNTGLEWPIVPAALVTILVFAPLLGLALNVAVFRPLARATESAKIMATVGLLIALPALCTFVIDEIRKIFDADIPGSSDISQVGFPSGIGPVPRKNWKLPGDVPFDSNQLVVFVAAAVCAVGLWYLLRRTSLGLQMRAVVDRPDLARMRGVDDGRTSRYAWMIGMVLAALAGVVGAPIFGSLSLPPFITIQFIATAAAVLGLLRSIPLAFVGGLLLGVCQTLVAGYADFAEDVRGFNASVPFVLLLAGLVVLGRDRSRRGGAAVDAVPPPDYLAGLPPWRRVLPWAVAVGFLVLYVLVLADNFWRGVMGMGLCLSLIFLSFVVVTGQGGLVTLAQAAIAACASMTAGMLMGRHGWPFLPALLVGVVVGVAIGVVVALPALRLGGIPLALATLALAFLSDLVLTQWNWFRKDQGGWRVNRIEFLGLDMDDSKTFAMVMLVIVGLVVLVVRNLQRSPSGRAITAVRTSEAAAQTSGISIVRTKLGLFATAAAIAAFGGVMLSMYRGSITGVSFNVNVGLLWLATVVLFGIRRPGAAVLAGIVSAASPEIIRAGFHWPDPIPSFLSWDGTRLVDIPQILFGLGAVQLARNPDGILAITAAQNHARRLKRQARRGIAPAPPAARLEAIEVAEEQAIAAETIRHEQELVAAGVLRSHGTGTVAHGDAVLSLRGVRSGYGDVEVLHGIDLAVAAGRITALLGANGSGKSTLCSTISGLVPLSQGTIVLHGTEIGALPAHVRARRGVRVAPESRGIFPGLTVEENLGLVLDAGEIAQACARFPRLGERRNLPAGSLSGGEQQMLTLAPLLVRPPDVLIADEPTLGLAPLVVTELLGVFGELRDRGVALLLVEEKARDVLEIADSVALLELGHVVWQGPRADVDQQRLAAAYLGGVGAR